MFDSGLLAQGNVDYSQRCYEIAGKSDYSGCARWNGRGYVLILAEAGVDWLQSGTQGQYPAFYTGPWGILHLSEVGATSGSEIWDFRSRMGLFGPGSMQVVVNQSTRFSFVDVDRWNPYEGLWPMLAHFLFEVPF